MKLTPKQIHERFERLKSDRTNWEEHWQDVADYVSTNKNNITRTTEPGEKKNIFLYESTAVQANVQLAGALHGMLTSPNNVWFALSTGDEELDEQDDVRLFLQESSDILFNTLNNSNFQTEVHEVYLDLGCFGTSGLAIEEDEENYVRFLAIPIRELFLQEDARGFVDEVYRCHKYTASQIVREYGMDNLSKKVKAAYDAGSMDKFEVVHAIYPEDDTKKIYRYVSDHILIDELKELRSGFFIEKPIVVPRWSKVAGEIYGRSPAMNALPDIKMINEVTKTTIKGAQKAVDPPLMLPDDGFILPILTKPGGLNYYRSGSADKIMPFANDSRVDFGFQLIQNIQARIKDAFFMDQLQLQQGPQMTATEVNQRTEEKMRLLGPMLGRQQSEFLRPLIDRVFNILIRRNVIKRDKIPAVLAGKKLDVHYTSYIARVQKTQEANNLMRAIQLATPFIQTDPSTLDLIDGDAAIKYIMNTYGVPQKLLRNVDDIAQRREARSQQQQQAQQQASQTITLDNAKTMSDIANAA